MSKGKKRRRDLLAIKRIQKNFITRGFTNTARWLNFLYENIKENNPSDYKKDFDDIADAYEKDIKSYGDYPFKCYREIKQIFGSVLAIGPKKRKKLRLLLTDVDPYFQDWIKTQKNLINIANITKEDMNFIAKYYLYSFAYMIAIEGYYESWIKILYYLYYNIISNPISLEKIEILALRDMKNWLISNGIDDVIFEGYKNGHLRNAIAHANFHYNKSTNKMLFIDYHKGVEKYREELSLIDFQDFFQKILIIPDLCAQTIMILRIHDIILKLQK